MSNFDWRGPGWDYEGHNVYEFSNPMRGYGELPEGVTIEDIIANMDDYIVDVGGIQMVKPEVKQPIMETLDSMSFEPDGEETAPTVTGEANFSLFSGSSGFASDYKRAGYAILVLKTSVEDGHPKMLMTKMPQVIANRAVPGAGYVVVRAPGDLLEEAQALSAQPVDPGTPPPGTEPLVAKASTTGWVLPVVVGIAVVGLIGVVASQGKK